jgi:cytochrome c biogenesis protein CcmG, thiol:disulfide interchange protein DsbE
VKHPARWIALSVAAVVVVLGVILALNVGNDPQLESQSNRLLGRDAPAFNLSTLSGPKVTRDGLAGKAVIVNFWNTWCIPCQKELPELKAFYQAHANDPDFAMVGIVRDAQKSKSGIADYVRKEGMEWTIALDPESSAALDFATRGQPETFAITPDGQIVGFQLAEVTKANLETMLGAARGQQ